MSEPVCIQRLRSISAVRGPVPFAHRRPSHPSLPADCLRGRSPTCSRWSKPAG